MGYTIAVQVVEAASLSPGQRSNGLCDAYCNVRLKSSPKEKKRTRIVEKTLNPSWNERFYFTSADTSTALIFHVWDHRPVLSNQRLGALEVPLTDVQHDRDVDLWLPLTKATQGRLHIKVAVSKNTPEQDNVDTSTESSSVASSEEGVPASPMSESVVGVVDSEDPEDMHSYCSCQHMWLYFAPPGLVHLLTEVELPVEFTNKFKKILQRHWKPGMSEESHISNHHTYSLLGNPWATSGSDLRRLHYMVINIIKLMRHHDCILETCSYLPVTADYTSTASAALVDRHRGSGHRDSGSSSTLIPPREREGSASGNSHLDCFIFRTHSACVSSSHSPASSASPVASPTSARSIDQISCSDSTCTPRRCSTASTSSASSYTTSSSLYHNTDTHIWSLLFSGHNTVTLINPTTTNIDHVRSALLDKLNDDIIALETSSPDTETYAYHTFKIAKNLFYPETEGNYSFTHSTLCRLLGVLHSYGSVVLTAFCISTNAAVDSLLVMDTMERRAPSVFFTCQSIRPTTLVATHAPTHAHTGFRQAVGTDSILHEGYEDGVLRMSIKTDQPSPTRTTKELNRTHSAHGYVSCCEVKTKSGSVIGISRPAMSLALCEKLYGLGYQAYVPIRVGGKKDDSDTLVWRSLVEIPSRSGRWFFISFEDSTHLSFGNTPRQVLQVVKRTLKPWTSAETTGAAKTTITLSHSCTGTDSDIGGVLTPQTITSWCILRCFSTLHELGYKFVSNQRFPMSFGSPIPATGSQSYDILIFHRDANPDRKSFLQHPTRSPASSQPSPSTSPSRQSPLTVALSMSAGSIS